MYSLVVVLSLLASASFVLAFLHGRRGHLIALGGWMTLLLYTHAWGLCLAAAMAVRVGRAVAPRPGRGPRRAAGRRRGAAALRAVDPDADRRRRSTPRRRGRTGRRRRTLLVDPVHPLRRRAPLAATPLLVIAVLAALRRRARPRRRDPRAGRDRRRRRRSLAWLGSQIEPAWANRYFAVFLGPAGARARGDPRARRAPAPRSRSWASWRSGSSTPRSRSAATCARSPPR